MGRPVDNGRPAPTDPVGELLTELGLPPEDPRQREIAAEALDPDNLLRELDLAALQNLAAERRER